MDKSTPSQQRNWKSFEISAIFGILGPLLTIATYGNRSNKEVKFGMENGRKLNIYDVSSD